MPLADWFAEVCDAQDGPTAFAAILAHPALLWDARRPAIERAIDARPAAERAGLRSHLGAMASLAGNLAKSPNEWPPDAGPVHAVARKVVAGEWTLERGLAAAADPEVCEALAPLYVHVTSRRAQAQAADGGWSPAAATYRVLMAAVDALAARGPGAEAMLREVALGWVQVAGCACGAVPDGQLFTDAKARAQAYVESEADPVAAAEAMHLLGVLHLDPWASGRSSQDFEGQIRRWRGRLADVCGAAAAADPAAAMPEPAAAFAEAVAWFRRALPHRAGLPRARTLKAMAEALSWLSIAGGPADPGAVRAAATEALSLFRPGRDDVQIRAMRALLDFVADQSPEPGAGERSGAGAAGAPLAEADRALLWLDPADVIRADGETIARERYVSLGGAMAGDDPHGALALMLRLWPALGRDAAEEPKRALLRVLSLALIAIADAPAVLQAAGADPAALRPALAEAAGGRGWPRGRQVAALAGLGLALTGQDRETEALELFETVLEAAPEAAPAMLEPLRVLQADLMLGSAVNAYAAKDWDLAIERYVAALPHFVRLGMPESALEMLARAADVTFAAPDRSPQTLALGLAQSAAELAAIGPARVGDRLRETWDKVLARLTARQPMNPVLLWLVLQAAKGAPFAAMLLRSGYDWRLDAEAATILARIAELAAARPPAVAPPAEADEWTLVSFAGGYGAPDAADEPLANLERRFDDHVARRMTDGRDALEAFLIGPPLAEAIGARTALSSFCAGRAENGRNTLLNVVQAGEQVFLAQGLGDMPHGVALLGPRGRGAEMTLWAPSVVALRRAVTDEPGEDDVVPEAAAQLAADFARLFGGGLADRLSELRAAGRDHLCLHPHGPFHFYPLHLLGPLGKPLADDWIVTTLPHPALLRRRADAAAAGAGRLPVAALGLDFAGGRPHGLPELKGAADEARAVAGALGGPAWVNEEATEARLLEALTGAERVHIATHGRHDAAAPMFQRLFLSPDPASDGMFHAYEALGLDLSHLDLVTLSACETGLGRCDASDTLRGLPATLFAAGAATIVATLWPVADRPARLFFETLYGGIARGLGKLDAFRAAQTATRAACPAYRDWGAFQYAGLW